VVVFHESTKLTVVLVGLRAGQSLPVQPGPAASFLFLDGEAVTVVGADQGSSLTELRVALPSDL